MPDPIIIITPPKKPPNADLTTPGDGFIRSWSNGISVTSALVSAVYQVTNGVDLGYRIEVQEDPGEPPK